MSTVCDTTREIELERIVIITSPELAELDTWIALCH